MVAMRNATENAREMVSELTLAYNKLRQAKSHAKSSKFRLAPLP